MLNIWKRAEGFISSVVPKSEFSPISFFTLRLRRRIYLAKKLSKKSPTLQEKYDCIKWLFGNTVHNSEVWIINRMFDCLVFADDDDIENLHFESFYGRHSLIEEVHSLVDKTARKKGITRIQGYKEWSNNGELGGDMGRNYPGYWHKP